MTPALLKASRKHTCGRASSGARRDAAQHRYKRPQNNFCEHRDIFSKASREGAKVQPPPFPNKKQVSPCACENLAVQSARRQLGFPDPVPSLCYDEALTSEGGGGGCSSATLSAPEPAADGSPRLQSPTPFLSSAISFA